LSDLFARSDISSRISCLVQFMIVLVGTWRLGRTAREGYSYTVSTGNDRKGWKAGGEGEGVVYSDGFSSWIADGSHIESWIELEGCSIW
jgi:hypothetical protein